MMSKTKKHCHNWQMRSAGMYWSEYECIVCKITWIEQDDDPDTRPHPEGRKRPKTGCFTRSDYQLKGAEMKYEYPEGLTISGIEGIMLDEKTRLAIIGAAEWMEENPHFEPKFEQLFNVILAKDEETVAMTEAVFARKKVKVDDQLPGMPFLGVDFPTYCIAVTMIHRHGWLAYIEHLYNRMKETKAQEEKYRNRVRSVELEID